MARLAPLALVLSLFTPVFSQQPVSPFNTYERLICIVPIVGAGTAADPKRPMYVPLPKRGEAPSRDGIIGFAATMSDDGKYAIVELVARDRAAFRQIFDEKLPQVRVFEKGKASKADMESEFRKVKKGFDLEGFGVSVP